MKEVSVKIITCSFLALLLFHSSLAPAQEDEVLLSESQIEELNSEARTLYSKAVAAFDRVLKIEGLALLAEAAAADPEHVHLQLITAQIALQLARAGYGRSNTTDINLTENTRKEITTDYWTGEYYQIALTCTQRVLDLRNLPRDLLDWAQNLNRVINIEIAGFPRRRQIRIKASHDYMLAHSQAVMAYRLAEMVMGQGGEGAEAGGGIGRPPINPMNIDQALNQINTGDNSFTGDNALNQTQEFPGREAPPVTQPAAPSRSLLDLFDILISLF